MNFLKRKEQDAKNLKVVNKRRPRNQQSVYEAVKEIGKPCTGRMVAEHLSWDSASVTNRLAEITRKGWIRVAYRMRCADGMYRNFYVAKDK